MRRATKPTRDFLFPFFFLLHVARVARVCLTLRNAMRALVRRHDVWSSVAAPVSSLALRMMAVWLARVGRVSGMEGLVDGLVEGLVEGLVGLVDLPRFTWANRGKGGRAAGNKTKQESAPPVSQLCRFLP